ELTPEDLKRRIDRGEDLFILDVRNPEEFQIGRIPGSTLIPLPDLPQRFRELDPGREIVVHCKSGMRSAKAIQFLWGEGLENRRNWKGGILAGSERVDRSVPKYKGGKPQAPPVATGGLDAHGGPAMSRTIDWMYHRKG